MVCRSPAAAAASPLCVADAARIARLVPEVRQADLRWRCADPLAAAMACCLQVASAITPVPGGVGPMTIAAVLHNTLKAARYQANIEKW